MHLYPNYIVYHGARACIIVSIFFIYAWYLKCYGDMRGFTSSNDISKGADSIRSQHKTNFIQCYDSKK